MLLQKRADLLPLDIADARTVVDDLIHCGFVHACHFGDLF